MLQLLLLDMGDVVTTELLSEVKSRLELLVTDVE